MQKLKQFLEGCVTAVEGLDRATGALRGARRQPAPNDYIDVTHGPEMAAYGPGPAPGPGGPERALPPLNSEVVATYRNVKTIDERVAYIVGMVQKGRHSATIREFAVKEISKKCGSRWCAPEGDHWAEVQALFAACKERYRYCSDAYGIDQFQHPERTLEWAGGDCDDATILICSALGAVGFQTKARVIQTTNAEDWNHIYALVGLPQKRPTKFVPLDLSVPKPAGWQPERALVKRVRDFEIPLVG